MQRTIILSLFLAGVACANSSPLGHWTFPPFTFPPFTKFPPRNRSTVDPPHTIAPPSNRTFIPPYTKHPPSNRTFIPPYTKVPPSNRTFIPPYTKHPPSNRTFTPPYTKHPPSSRTSIPPYTKIPPSKRTSIPPYTKVPPSNRTSLPPYTKVPPSNRTSLPPYTKVPPSNRTSLPPYTKIPPSKRTSIPPYTKVPPSNRTSLPPYTKVPPSNRTVFPPHTKLPSSSRTTWFPPFTEFTTKDWHTTPAPTHGPHPAKQCACTYKKIWLDVFFLIDSSGVMTSHRMDNAVAFALSVVQKMTVGQGEKEMRVGWIEFAAKAKVLYNLTHWHSTEELTDGLEMIFNGSAGAAVNSAIRLASSSFKAPAHRPNAKKLIVIIASDGHKTNYSDAVKASLDFKAKGGDIITVEYAQGLCKERLLGKLATDPSYAFSNCDGPLNIDKVRKAFCDANCFCMKQYKPFDKPANGCYRAVGIPAEQKLASRSCYFHYSTLATVDSYAKAEFLAELMPPWESKFWIGLERNSYGAFVWPDGEEVRNTFNMWAAGYPKAQGDCVYMTRTGERLVWHNANCDSDENYACERRPCDTDNYCLVDDE